jgi:hypothetical protein
MKNQKNRRSNMENPNLETFKKRLEWFRMLREYENDVHNADMFTKNEQDCFVYRPLEN